LITTFEGRTGLTPYVQWAGRWGHAPLWVLSVLVLVFLVPRKRPE
jgi:apolipoprotein N-acyltransferase